VEEPEITDVSNFEEVPQQEENKQESEKEPF